jgi:hypothetical protein
LSPEGFGSGLQMVLGYDSFQDTAQKTEKIVPAFVKIFQSVHQDPLYFPHIPNVSKRTSLRPSQVARTIHREISSNFDSGMKENTDIGGSEKGFAGRRENDK